MSRWDDEQHGHDPLARELRGLVGSGWEAPRGGAAAAVRTGRRRLVVRTAGVSALCAALVVGVPVGLSLGSTTAAPVPPAVEEPGPTAETTVQVPPPAATVPAPTASATGPSELEIEDPEDRPVEAGTLVGLRVTRLQPGVDPAVVQVTSAGGRWAVDPCGDGASITDKTRTGWFAAMDASPSSDTSVVHQAATYADPAAARAVVADVLSEMERCAGLRIDDVWEQWGEPLPDGSVRIVSYDLGRGFYREGATADVQSGGSFRIGVQGSTVVLTGLLSAYSGTAIAYALGDDDRRVGPPEWAGTPSDVDATFVGLGQMWSAFGADVAAHLDGGTTRQTGSAAAGEAYPPAVDAAQGGRYWTVVAAVVRDAADPRVGQAEQDLEAAGYSARLTADVECLAGAREALGLTPERSYTVVAVTFASRADAIRMVDLYPHGVVGTAEVTVGCVD